MRRARLFKNANGSFDLVFSGTTAGETRSLMKAVAGMLHRDDGTLPDAEPFDELCNQLFDRETGRPITHLRNPVVIGEID